MRELERRVQRDLDRIADHAPDFSDSWAQLRHRIDEEPDRTEEEVIMLAPAEPTSTRPRWTTAVAVAFTGVAALALAGIIALRATDETDIQPATTDIQPATTDIQPATTDIQPATTIEADSTAVIEVDWQYGSALPGSLRHVTLWSEGLAAIMDPDGDETPAGGNVWYSTDGVEWNDVPSALPATAFMLAGQNGDLFALTGAPEDAATPQTLWRRRAGELWTEVITSNALDHIAVGPDRLIAYGEGGFDIVGVFDAATLAPVEFADLPTIELKSTDTGPVTSEPFEPVVLQGHSIALDEGFLAHIDWITAVEDGEAVREQRLLHSADGSVWIEHPSPPDGAMILPSWAATPVHDGLNLLSHPNQLDTEPWVTDDGLSFSAATDPGWNGPTGTDAGFFSVDESNRIHQSSDGITWDVLQAPPTWSPPAGDSEVHWGSIFAHGDRLLAIGARGDFEGWVGIVNPSTEIWFADR